ncbi:hypothetical protein HHL14_30765 [Paraburkholderia sp. G-4-1-8]|uniref:OmpA-like domain-containing protein n=2 Tax=Paraburkholderia antibiotica TaxID=2728839 RepID=A0A7Y0FGI9_9BURK|nr:hypothetical protein [Paraburkholderia antibiotica]
MEFELPFNTTSLSNENLQEIEMAVKDAKKWPPPAIGIQATVTAGAYIGEHDLDVLQKNRGEAVEAYLRKLGIPSENIYVDPVIMTDDFLVKRTDGELAVRQVEIELAPICKGSCQWMCGDPRPKQDEEE